MSSPNIPIKITQINALVSVLLCNKPSTLLNALQSHSLETRHVLYDMSSKVSHHCWCLLCWTVSKTAQCEMCLRLRWQSPLRCRIFVANLRTWIIRMGAASANIILAEVSLKNEILIRFMGYTSICDLRSVELTVWDATVFAVWGLKNSPNNQQPQHRERKGY